ncbi:MAG TPA: hypothetical protein VGR28_14220, partial [Candidatus Thermoplasmatota archaeon]|nr:hypothetical protein [Candidatus Thermoplasmatota archaeon]
MSPRRPPARARLALAFAAAALLPALVHLLPAPAAAATSGPVELAYTVDASDPALLAGGKVRVAWAASNFEDRISAFCLQVDGHEYDIDTATFGPALWVYHPTDVDPPRGKPACPTGFRAVVQDTNSVEARYTLDVRKPAFSPCGCEFNSYLGSAWGVVKAEALAVPFSYAFFNEPGCPAEQSCPPPFHATVRFLLPEDWSVEAPWTHVGPTTFSISDEPPLPRGFFALGTFTPEPHVSAGTGKEFVYVRLAAELRDKKTLFDY